MPSGNGAIDHVLPIGGQAEIDQGVQQRIPHALFGPATEPDVDGVPFAVAFMHVVPWTTHPQRVEHAVEKTPIVVGRAASATALGGQQRSNDLPLLVSQIAAYLTGPRKEQC